MYIIYTYKGRLKAGNNKGKFLTTTSKRPSVTGLNSRLLTSFDGHVSGISTTPIINNVQSSNYS